jgi:hypothetical protein
MTDKRKLRLILPCDDYGILWIKGEHLHDEDFCRHFIERQKHFKDATLGNLSIDNHGYCCKVRQEDCPDPDAWICQGNYAWMDCPKDTKGAVPYTEINYEILWSVG